MIVSRRSETAADEAFIRRMVIESVSEELHAHSWPEPVRDHLLGIQYTSRRHSISENYPEGKSEIILVDGVSAGWIYSAEMENQIRLVEIMVSLAHRGQGVGAIVIRELLAAADGAGKPVTLAVSTGNPQAQRLYERLGFRRTGGDDTRHEMARYCAPRPADRHLPPHS